MLVAGLVVAAPPAVEAAGPCSLAVSKTLKRSADIAGGATLSRYVASVGSRGTSKYDQRARVIVTRFPDGVVPRLVAVRIGEQAATGVTARAVAPRALAAVNGDFFPESRIRGKNVRLVRGPMVQDGRVVRATVDPMRVVGVTTKGVPFGGRLGVNGTVSVGTEPAVAVMGLNWQSVDPGGVTVYTSDWTRLSSAPRPAGRTEWVLDATDTLVKVRSARAKPERLGSPVAEGTRVVAFAADLARPAARATEGVVVAVSIRQSTRPRAGARLQTAVGRGLTLVQDGVAGPRDCDEYLNGARPRTVVGWTRDGLWRAVTVPGTEFVGDGLRVGGFGLAQIANVARRMGLVHAFELDGGGSTTLYTRRATVWSRRDLWGVRGGTYERAVPNGLAFVAR